MTSPYRPLGHLVKITPEMLGPVQPDLITQVMNAPREAAREARVAALAVHLATGHPLPPGVTIGEYRDAATRAGLDPAMIEATIDHGTAYLADLVASCAEPEPDGGSPE